VPIATDPLSRLFFALADPTRRAMLDRLAGGSATVGELAEPFAMSRPAISQHLGVLEEAGLIERTRQGQWRSCTLRPGGLDGAERWVAEHRAAWQSRFDRLDETLAALVAGERGEAPAGDRAAARRSADTGAGAGADHGADAHHQAGASVGEPKEQ
jgi:DNA-binding transcriptional ArsR family regulator